MAGWGSPVAAWLLTYLVHSTLLLGGSWVLGRYVIRREALRETLWKTALVGGLVTATAAMALRPGTLRVALPALSSPSAAAASTEGVRAPAGGEVGDPGLASSAPEISEPEWSPGWEASGDSPVEAGQPLAGGGSSLATGEAGEAGAAAAGDVGVPVLTSGVVVVGALAVWAVVALALLGRLAYRHVRLRRVLGDRRQVPGSERVAIMLTELRRTAGVWTPVRLTSTPAVATPLALGTTEICLPERFLLELDPVEQRAALAHELAHLARRDPIWQVLGSVVRAVFFFQPLNRVASREIRAAAEYMADRWAVRQTGSHVELARCLASVAGWVAPSSEPALAGTVAMAEGGSPLLTRVNRLLEAEPEVATRPALRIGLAGALIAAAAGFGPVVGPAPVPVEAGGGGAPETSDPDPNVNTDSSVTTDSDQRAGAEWDMDVRRETDTDSARASTTMKGTETDQDRLRIQRLDGPALEGEGFVVRLNEAGRDAAGSPYWVAYAMEGGRSEELVIDSDPWSTGELGGERLANRLGLAGELRTRLTEPVVVLVRLVPEGAATRVDRITVRRPELGASLAGTVYWLGYPEVEESFRWFRDMYTTVGDSDIREAVVEVMGIHPTAGAREVMREILESEADGPVRGEAVEALGRPPSDTATARLLFRVALSDPDRGVRMQAAEALAEVEPGLAVELLARLARESDDERVQQQVAESLADVGTPPAVTALEELVTAGRSEDVRREALDQLAGLGRVSGGSLVRMAVTDDDPDLRREATELLGRLPPDEAVPLLRRVAFESGDGTAERQAAETLGDVGTEAALEVLREILERNPGEDASFQAVESVAENFPRPLALRILRDVVRNHPSSRVRREALDYLEDQGG